MVRKNKTQQRRERTRKKLQGTANRPRLSVYRSNKSMYVQIIDDTMGKTIVGISLAAVKEDKGTKLEKSKKLGTLIAEKALSKKVKQVVFDKGEYKYHGRVKAVAEGAREGGLEF